MFVTPEQLVDFTHKTRPSAQAKALAARGLKFDRRDDGTIALRQEELDRFTLTKPAAAEASKRWRVDLSQFGKTG